MKTIKTQPDLARLITELDEKNDGIGNQLNFFHATTISWKIMKEFMKGSSKKQMISNIVDSLPVIRTQGLSGNEKKGKFSYNQIDRVKDVLNEMLRWYWWPWSKIRKNLKTVCDRS